MVPKTVALQKHVSLYTPEPEAAAKTLRALVIFDKHDITHYIIRTL
jgi:hypothetical protein